MRPSSQNGIAASSPDGRQEITISTRTRLAASLCALSVALLCGGFGGPLASFATDPHPPSQDGETHEGGETQEAPGGLTGPMALSASTDDQPAVAAVTADNTGSGSSPAATSQESSQPETVVSHTPESSSDSQTTNAVAASLTNAEVNSLTSGEPNSSTDNQVNPPAGDPPAEQPAVVQPVTNAVESAEVCWRVACTRLRVYNWRHRWPCRQAGPECSSRPAIRPRWHLPAPPHIRLRRVSAPAVRSNSIRSGSRRCWRTEFSRSSCGRFCNTRSTPFWPRSPCWRSPHWPHPASPACCFSASRECSSGIARQGRRRCCGQWG